jgi:sulfoxide reductase heme-binding subunit YedZ
VDSLTGFAAYGALYLSVITGIGLSSAWGRRRLVRLGLGGSHEALSLCGLALAALHAWGGLPRQAPGAALGWLLPWLAPDTGLAVGAAALDLLVVVTAGFYLRRRLGSPLWRWVHALAYPAFAFAAAHGLMIGANAWLSGVKAMYAATLGTAAAAAGLRAAEGLRGRRRRGRLAPTG